MGDAVGSFVNGHAHPTTSQQSSKSHVLSPKSYACLIYSEALFVVFTVTFAGSSDRSLLSWLRDGMHSWLVRHRTAAPVRNASSVAIQDRPSASTAFRQWNRRTTWFSQCHLYVCSHASRKGDAHGWIMPCVMSCHVTKRSCRIWHCTKQQRKTVGLEVLEDIAPFEIPKSVYCVTESITIQRSLPDKSNNKSHS